MTVKIPYVYQYDFDYAKLEIVSPLVRRITARNPSGFTFNGTGTYIIGHGNVAVIDPGPMIDEHIKALEHTLSGERVTHILITHTHMDHSPAAEPLKQIWGSPTFGFGRHGAGKIAEGTPIEEGGDMAFEPDHHVSDGEIIQGDGWTIECVYTPGHTSNHMCYCLQEEKALFTGDHVMGWSTSVIGPPDGDMTAYMDSLKKLQLRDDQIYWPTHGTAITDVQPFVQAFIDHRGEREQQIMACLREGITQIPDMVPVMYPQTDPRMFPAAERSVLSAMIRLIETGEVLCSETPTTQTTFSLPE